jgi:hypothetical protein|tara:strand:+ start:308 stop:520 length:213 start_codon:yes stop_codon:yes gene_type:complete
MVRSKEMNDWLDEWSATLDEHDIDVLGEREPMSIEMFEKIYSFIRRLMGFSVKNFAITQYDEETGYGEEE